MWFSARLLYRSVVDDATGVPPLYEESIILVDAGSEEAARAEAERIAYSREHSYPNVDGTEVRWKFVRVLETQDLCEETLFSGVEVHSRLFRSTSEPE